MEVTQLKDLITKAVSQATGKPIEDLSTFELVDMGRDVIDAGQVDSFVKGLLNMVGKIVVESKTYTADLPDVFIDGWEWGAYLERVYPDLNGYDINNSWNLVNGQEYPAHIFYQPNVSAKIFEELKTIETRISIAGEEQIKTAFNSWDEMNRFTGGIMQSIENTLELALEEIGAMLITSGFAISDKATQTAVHLVTEFNATFNPSTPLTEDTALHSIPFLRFAVSKINLYRSYFKRMTKGIFNNGNINSWARGDSQKLVLLSDFTSNLKTILLGSSETFNPSEYSLGEYKELPWLQSPIGESTKLTMKDNTHIKITADATNKLGIGTDAYDKTGAIGLLYDYRAIGMTMNRRKVTSEYTASADFWTYYHKLAGNYIIDTNFPMVAFFLD